MNQRNTPRNGRSMSVDAKAAFLPGLRTRTKFSSNKFFFAVLSIQILRV